MADAYYFLKKDKSEEVHIFLGEFTSRNPNRCDHTKVKVSICKKVDKKDTIPLNKKTRCLNENEARVIASELGRKVCGTCVSSLYSNY